MTGCVTRKQKGKTVMGKRHCVGGGGGGSGWLVSLGGKRPQELGPLERGEKVSGILVRLGRQSPMLDFFPS